jgi:group I intron endonuclease
LEYCDKKETLIREQYYLDLLKPEYNILKKAGSALGFKHSEEAKIKMRGPKIEVQNIQEN